MLQLVVSFDITGSMASVLKLVNRNLKNLISNLPSETEVVFIAHGNHADSINKKIMYSGEFKPVAELANWLNNKDLVSGHFGGSTYSFTGRGGCAAIYEHALWRTNALQWKEEATKALVVIGDEEPSSLSYGLDYRIELTNLVHNKITCYGVQCLNNQRASYFYKELSEKTGGVHLTLDQFSDINELLLAVAYKEQNDGSLESFAKSLQQKARMSRSLLGIFNNLSGQNLGEKLNISFTKTSGSSGELEPVPPYRFQIMDVLEDQDIKSFILETGAAFKRGAGFYELTKSETIQENKEVVVQDKKSGDMFSGEAARDLLGIPFGSRGTVRPSASLSKYNVFIQSTSNNRKLTKGTKFLYEVDLT